MVEVKFFCIWEKETAKNIDKVSFSLSVYLGQIKAMSEELKEITSKIKFMEENFDDFEKEMSKTKEMTGAKFSVNDIVDVFSKAYDMSWNNLHLDVKSFTDQSVKTTIQLPYELSFFDGGEKTNGTVRFYITYKTRRRGELAEDEIWQLLTCLVSLF